LIILVSGDTRQGNENLSSGEKLNFIIMANIERQNPKQQVIQMIETLDENISMDGIIKAISGSPRAVWKNPVPKWVFISTGLAAFATFIYFVVGNYDSNGKFETAKEASSKIVLFDYLLYAIWTIIPPSYFLWEYLRLFPHKLDSNQMADLKYTQELSSKIWAALLFAFGILLYSKYGVR
jgi:hypothetical protein